MLVAHQFRQDAGQMTKVIRCKPRFQVAVLAIRRLRHRVVLRTSRCPLGVRPIRH